MFLEVYASLFATGVLAGAVDAIAGGGGLITVPMLLSVGVPPHVALGTNKLQSFFGTAMAAYSYHKHGWLQKQGLVKGLICSFMGAIVGAVLSQCLNNDFLKKIIPILLLLVLVYTIFTPRLGTQEQSAKLSETVFYIVFGSLLGFYDGFLGPGTGSFWVICLVYFLGQSLMRATAYTKVFNLNSNSVALICFAFGNNIDYKIGFCMAVGQIMGAHCGARLAIRRGILIIRPLFIIMVTITLVSLIYKNYF